VSAPIEAIKKQPEHITNMVMSASYGVSTFLEHQYLILMSVAYLFVTMLGVGREVHHIHHFDKEDK